MINALVRRAPLILLAALLAVGAAWPAAAAAQADDPTHFRGALVSASASEISIRLDDGAVMTFALSADARLTVRAIGRTTSATDLAALPAGALIKLAAVQDAAGNWTALRVDAGGPRSPGRQIDKAELSRERVSGQRAAPAAAAARPSITGVVTAYAPGESIDVDGTTYALSDGTRILSAGGALAVDQKAMLLFHPDEAAVWAIVVLGR